MIKQKFVFLVTLISILLLWKSNFLSVVLNFRTNSLSIYSFAINDKKDQSHDFINLGFSDFEYIQAKLRETEIDNEYDITAVLLHWKRFDGLQRTLLHLLHTNLFKEIIVWNNNPQIKLTPGHFTKDNQSHTFIRIINSQENFKDRAKYLACAEAKTRACFYVDDDFNPTHYLKCLIASFRSDPNLLHAVTDYYTFYTNLVWSYFDLSIDLHSGFSWIGCGSVFLRQHAQHHLQLIHTFLQNHTGNQLVSVEWI